MDKKQKKMLISIFAILLLIVLLVGFTFAKYISTYNGKGKARIAKWTFKVNEWSVDETKELSLFDTLHHVDLEEGRIAPGYYGSFDVVLDATGSEVDLQYYIEARETGHKPENLEFQAIINRDQYTRFYPTLRELAENELRGVIERTAVDKVVPITINCVWPFESGDNEEQVAESNLEDTAAGKGSYVGQINTYDYGFSLKVVGTQARATAKN